ncbi:MAG TPA: hypothetical protein DEP05_05945 [Betaproteobacteria bacterium]|nr:hypothetical protein [Betaproteobacteria bacterium]
MQAQPVGVIPIQAAESGVDVAAGGQALGTDANALSGLFSTVLANQLKEQLAALETGAGVALTSLGGGGKKLTEGELADLLQTQRALTPGQPAPDSLAALVMQLAAALQSAQSPAAPGRQKSDGQDGLPLTLPANKASPRLAHSERLLEAAAFAANGKTLPLPTDDAKNHWPVARDHAKETVSSLPPVQLPITAAPAPHAAQNAAAPATAANPAVTPQVGSSHWGSALGQRIVWMVGQHQHAADLQLNPPHLGPLEVKLTFSHDQLNAVFVSHHAMVREAIEGALPRLREMLAEGGIAMGNVMVGADSSSQQQSAFSGQRGGHSGARDDAAPFGVSAVSFRPHGMTLLRDDGMVDTFV